MCFSGAYAFWLAVIYMYKDNKLLAISSHNMHKPTFYWNIALVSAPNILLKIRKKKEYDKR